MVWFQLLYVEQFLQLKRNKQTKKITASKERKRKKFTLSTSSIIVQSGMCY